MCRQIEKPSVSFESKFARLQYAASRRFNLACFNRTGERWELSKLLSLEDCLAWLGDGNIISLCPSLRQLAGGRGVGSNQTSGERNQQQPKRTLRQAHCVVVPVSTL